MLLRKTIVVGMEVIAFSARAGGSFPPQMNSKVIEGNSGL